MVWWGRQKIYFDSVKIYRNIHTYTYSYIHPTELQEKLSVRYCTKKCSFVATPAVFFSLVSNRSVSLTQTQIYKRIRRHVTHLRTLIRTPYEILTLNTYVLPIVWLCLHVYLICTHTYTHSVLLVSWSDCYFRCVSVYASFNASLAW